MDKTNRNYLKELQRYRDLLQNNRFYSLQRLDVLVIILSTSGIILIVNLIQSLFSSTGETKVILWLKFSILSYVFSIISNLLSQHYSYLCHDVEGKIVEDKIFDLTYDEKIEDKKHESLESKSKAHNQRVKTLNVCSLLLLFLGMLISLVTFWVAV